MKFYEDDIFTQLLDIILVINYRMAIIAFKIFLFYSYLDLPHKKYPFSLL